MELRIQNSLIDLHAHVDRLSPDMKIAQAKIEEFEKTIKKNMVQLCEFDKDIICLKEQRLMSEEYHTDKELLDKNIQIISITEERL